MEKSKVFKYLIIALFIIIIFIFTLINISKYRFSYFIKGPIVQYTHNKSDIITLNDGRILMTGRTPSGKGAEIFNPKTGKLSNLGYKF